MLNLALIGVIAWSALSPSLKMTPAEKAARRARRRELAYALRLAVRKTKAERSERRGGRSDPPARDTHRSRRASRR
jgi:hypothetical protein